MPIEVDSIPDTSNKASLGASFPFFGGIGSAPKVISLNIDDTGKLSIDKVLWQSSSNEAHKAVVEPSRLGDHRLFMLTYNPEPSSLLLNRDLLSHEFATGTTVIVGRELSAKHRDCIAACVADVCHVVDNHARVGTGNIRDDVRRTLEKAHVPFAQLLGGEELDFVIREVRETHAGRIARDGSLSCWRCKVGFGIVLAILAVTALAVWIAGSIVTAGGLSAATVAFTAAISGYFAAVGAPTAAMSIIALTGVGAGVAVSLGSMVTKSCEAFDFCP